MRAKWANTFPRWPPHSIEGRTYELSHLHPFRYPLLLPERPNQAAREVEIRVAFSAHTFTRGCSIAERPDYHYSTGPRDPEVLPRPLRILKNITGRRPQP